MSQTRILSPFPPTILARVCEEVQDVELIQIPAGGELDPEIRGDVLLTPPLDSGNLAETLERGIRWVHAIGTGVDRFPLSLLAERPLTCARGASSIPIAEWILACMLAYEKRMPEIWLDAAPAEWSSTQLGTLHGKTLGLIGLGGIGEAVAQLALLFGMRVCALRHSDRPSPISGIEIVQDLAKLLEVADHCVLALPLTRDSLHLINRESLAAIPRDANMHLVNISRGGLIHQEALREALEDGRIGCASLDVSDPEPLPDGHWLYAHPSVRLSAHNSWNTPDAFGWLLDTFIENLRRYRAGEELEGMVNIEAGY
jgi:phosphoglycerate dehydrogenase-like enzyme